jgi:hypothetical protein
VALAEERVDFQLLELNQRQQIGNALVHAKSVSRT